jgi:RNA polymerase sigma-70 factor (ECF subfamily)
MFKLSDDILVFKAHLNKDIKRIKKRDINAITDWFGIRKDKYYRIGWSYLYNRYDIEDVFHSSIIKVYENIHQLREDRCLETWVTSIFINECKRILREKSRTVDMESMEYAGSFEDHSNIDLKMCLERIDQIYKEVIILKYISGYSQEEVAELLGIPIGTVKSRIYRGIQLLKENMKKEALE